jgi:hypothetical protein
MGNRRARGRPGGTGGRLARARRANLTAAGERAQAVRRMVLARPAVAAEPRVVVE